MVGQIQIPPPGTFCRETQKLDFNDFKPNKHWHILLTEWDWNLDVYLDIKLWQSKLPKVFKKLRKLK